MDVLVNTALWLTIMPVATFIHEAGHVVMTRVLHGDKGWSIHLGSGKVIFNSERLKIRTLFFWGGLARFTKTVDARWRKIMRSAGGSLANLLCIGGLLLLSLLTRMDYTVESETTDLLNRIANIFLIANIANAVIPLIPVTYRSGIFVGLDSDGLSIIRYIRGEK
ncbi:MAG: hypothetical protein FWD97_08450 [Defluviitaleaceae bacterium]|nr:hypothetical protein [Defluviitaleaceae bacterium]